MPTSWTGTFDEGICLGAFCQSSGDASHFIGSLDDFGIWDRPLSPLEIEGLYSWTPFGCTDDNACNYSPEASVDDGSCTYHHIAEESIITSCDSYYWNELLLTEGGTFSTVELDSIEGLIYGGYFDGAHYLISNDVMEWSDGEALAESLGGWLCVLNTEEELDFVMNSIAEFFTPASATNGASSGAWIGLYNQEWINGESGIMQPCVHLDGDGAFGMLNLNDELYPGGSAAPCLSDEQESWFDVASIIEIPEDSIDAVYTLNLTLLSCADVQTFCGPGTTWDEPSQSCVIANPSDTDFDGCVGINDFLVHLSNFGSGCGPEPAWACGDPLEYQGYDYETVQIGEQCWFAENLRVDTYLNGDAISQFDGQGWASANEGGVSVYGEDGMSSCVDYSPTVESCDPSQALVAFGRIYNWYAISDDRGLCPSNWHVPSDEDFMELEVHIGIDPDDVGTNGWRGNNEGNYLKTQTGWHNGGNGSNDFGFDLVPAGARGTSGQYDNAGRNGYLWTSTSDGSSAYYRRIEAGNASIARGSYVFIEGYPARCIKDTE